MGFEIESLFIWLVVGAVAGWLAGKIMKSKRGLVNNIILGIIGAFIGGWLLPALGVPLGVGMVSAIITATVGAVFLLFIINLIKK